jgi:cation transport regulator
MEAFNSAWEQYADPDKRRDDASREEVAHRVAWSAVKEKYEKKNSHWARKSS